MSLIEFLFPDQCVVCSKIGDTICSDCIKKISRCPPSCPICGRVSGYYYIHKRCHQELSQGFTGWYLSESLKNQLDKKVNRGVFSTHFYLLNNLINYLHLNEIIKDSYILPLYSEDKNRYALNCSLSKNITQKGDKNSILFIGNSWEEINNTITYGKGLPIKKPLYLRTLLLFREINPESLPS